MKTRFLLAAFSSLFLVACSSGTKRNLNGQGQTTNNTSNAGLITQISQEASPATPVDNQLKTDQVAEQQQTESEPCPSEDPCATSNKNDVVQDLSNKNPVVYYNNFKGKADVTTTPDYRLKRDASTSAAAPTGEHQSASKVSGPEKMTAATKQDDLEPIAQPKIQEIPELPQIMDIKLTPSQPREVPKINLPAPPGAKLALTVNAPETSLEKGTPQEKTFAVHVYRKVSGSLSGRDTYKILNLSQKLSSTQAKVVIPIMNADDYLVLITDQKTGIVHVSQKFSVAEKQGTTSQTIAVPSFCELAINVKKQSLNKASSIQVATFSDESSDKPEMKDLDQKTFTQLVEGSNCLNQAIANNDQQTKWILTTTSTESNTSIQVSLPALTEKTQEPLTSVIVTKLSEANPSEVISSKDHPLSASPQMANLGEFSAEAATAKQLTYYLIGKHSKAIFKTMVINHTMNVVEDLKADRFIFESASFIKDPMGPRLPTLNTDDLSKSETIDMRTYCERIPAVLQTKECKRLLKQ